MGFNTRANAQNSGEFLYCVCMNLSIRKSLWGGVITLALTSLFVNAAFADSSRDRLATYKANRLIPDNIILKVGNDNDAQATFILSQRTWATPENAKLVNLSDAFAGWSLEDFQNFDWPDKEKNEAYFNYLTKVETGEIIPECSELTGELAMELKMACFNSSLLRMVFGDEPAFEFSGNEVISKYAHSLSDINLKNCSGLVLSQLYDVVISSCILPTIQVNGDEKFRLLSFRSTDLTALKGLTVAQLLQFGLTSIDSKSGFANAQLDGTEDWSRCRLFGDISGWTGVTKEQCIEALSKGRGSGLIWPTITFDGTEDFSNLSLASIDFPESNLKGVTAEQITSTKKSLYGAVLPTLDFTGAKGFTQDITSVDFTRCSGLTVEQIVTSKDWSRIRLTSSQYESMKSGLAASLSAGQSKEVYVDGKSTTIRSSN